MKETAPDAQPDVLDDHYYKPSGEMLDFVHHYDNAPRTGPKIFVGEWATLSGTPTPDFGAALADSAWMTGMERNSDLIVMASYAPLLINVNPGAGQWYTNLIGLQRQHQLRFAQLLRAEPVCRAPGRRHGAELDHRRGRAVLLLRHGGLQGPRAAPEAGERLDGRPAAYGGPRRSFGSPHRRDDCIARKQL